MTKKALDNFEILIGRIRNGSYGNRIENPAADFDLTWHKNVAIDNDIRTWRMRATGSTAYEKEGIEKM